MPHYPNTLRKLLKEDELPAAKLLQLWFQVADAIAYAHEKSAFHRDLKPENILVDEKKERAVVADWGIAHLSEDELYTAVETKKAARLANFAYAAPEQRTKNQAVDCRSDIYALGLMLNELFTGQILQGAGYKKIADSDEAFAYLDDVVDTMVQQNPTNRAKNIRNIKAEIQLRVKTKESADKKAAIKELAAQRVAPVDDALVGVQVELTGVSDYDPGERTLSLELSHVVTPEWGASFRRVRPDRAPVISGVPIEPASFAVNGKWLSVQVPEAHISAPMNFVPNFVSQGVQQYQRDVQDRDRQSEESRLREIQRKIDETETRKRVMQMVKNKVP